LIKVSAYYNDIDYILTRDNGRRSESEPERRRKEDQRGVGRKINIDGVEDDYGGQYRIY
jgi:hypothetical protein